MGGKQSHDIDTLRIQEITKAVTDQFFKDFKLWYREIINEKVKARNIWKESRFQLLQAPVPHRPLKKGFVYKLGYNVKSWKRRYLVAYNKTDNFVLRYFDDNSLNRCRGSIDCCGYSVRTFSPEEDEHSYGMYGIQLVPSEEGKRVWFFRVSSAKEQDEWIQTFLNACKKTSPDPLRDIYYPAAFQRALKSTKASYGYYGLCEVVTSEVELLSQLTKRILRREMIDEYIQTHHQQLKKQSSSKRRSSSRSVSVLGGEGETPLAGSAFSFVATSSPQQDSIILISQVNDIVNSVIQPIIANTIKRTMLYVGETTAKYEDSVQASLSQLLQTERGIYDFLLKKLKPLIDPALNDLQTGVFQPVLETMFDKFLLSYDALFLNFSLQLMEKTKYFNSLQETIRGIDRLDNLIDTLSSDESVNSDNNNNNNNSKVSSGNNSNNNSNNNNCLLESYDILWKLMTKELIDVSELFEGCDIQPFSVIYLNTTEDMRQCIHNVLFTFKTLLRNGYEEEKEVQHQKYGHYSFWLKLFAQAHALPSSPLPTSTTSLSPKTPQKQPNNTPNTTKTPSSTTASATATTTASSSHTTSSSAKEKSHSSHHNHNHNIYHNDKSSSLTQPALNSPPPPPPHHNSSSSSAVPNSTSDILTRLDILYSYFEHDLYETMIARLIDILTDMVEITVQEAILMPGQEIFATARGMEREFAFIVHLPCLGERIVRDCVRAYLNHFLTSSLSSYGVRIKLQLEECRRRIWRAMKGSESKESLSLVSQGNSSLFVLPSQSTGNADQEEEEKEEEES